MTHRVILKTKRETATVYSGPSEHEAHAAVLRILNNTPLLIETRDAGSQRITRLTTYS